MSIKVTGTTVINDSLEIENVGDINRFIQQPVITNPVNFSTDNNVGITIEVTPYTPLYTADERLYREFEIDLDSGDFSNPQRSTQIDSDNFGPLDPTLDPDETYKVRVRDVSINGTVSEYSEVVTFSTVNVTIDTPSLTVQRVLDGTEVVETPELNTSSFSATGDTDTHESTDWEVVRTSDSVVVFSSYNDTTNLTSITITDGSLAESEEYDFRVRHRGATYGVSDFVTVTATMRNTFLNNASLGQSFCGGFYMGRISAAGTTYNLIVSPKSGGATSGRQWLFTNNYTGPDLSDVDGYANTYNEMTSFSFRAGNFASGRNINGFSDWYLPAIDEIFVIYNNGAGPNSSGDPLPTGEDFNAAEYWSSTDFSDARSCVFDFSSNQGSFEEMTDGYCVRAIRREPI